MFRVGPTTTTKQAFSILLLREVLQWLRGNGAFVCLFSSHLEPRNNNRLVVFESVTPVRLNKTTSERLLRRQFLQELSVWPRKWMNECVNEKFDLCCNRLPCPQPADYISSSSIGAQCCYKASRQRLLVPEFIVTSIKVQYMDSTFCPRVSVVFLTNNSCC